MARGTQSPAQQLATWMDAYAPEIRKRAVAALKELRAQVPGATEMVYDTFNALVIGFAPGERPSEAILSIGLYPRWVNLYFLEGAFLDDPAASAKGEWQSRANAAAGRCCDIEGAGGEGAHRRRRCAC